MLSTLQLLLALQTIAPASGYDAYKLCELKELVRWRSSSWSLQECEDYIAWFKQAASDNGFDWLFLVAVSVNESNLDEGATNPHYVDGKLSAVDGGLMGVRCTLGKYKRCINTPIKGLRPLEVWDPKLNVEIGAKIMAYYRDADFCAHKGHAYWSHYNWGHKVHKHGRARNYHRRVLTTYNLLGVLFDRGNTVTVRQLERSNLYKRLEGVRGRDLLIKKFVPNVSLNSSPEGTSRQKLKEKNYGLQQSKS